MTQSPPDNPDFEVDAPRARVRGVLRWRAATSPLEQTRELFCFASSEIGLQVKCYGFHGLLLCLDLPSDSKGDSSSERSAYFLLYQELENCFQLVQARAQEGSIHDYLVREKDLKIFSEIKIESFVVEERTLQGLLFTFKNSLPLGYAYEAQNRTLYKYDFEAQAFKKHCILKCSIPH